MRAPALLHALLLAAIVLFFQSCRSPGKASDGPIDEALRRPENLQEFAYADFGPPLFTNEVLGKPMPFDGVAEKREAGWPVGNIRVLVTAESYLEPQLIFLREAGRLDPAIDYRVLWYFEAISLLDAIIGNAEIPEEYKSRPREVRAKILKEMGSGDDIRGRLSELRDPLERHIREKGMHAEIERVGQSIMAKGQSR